VNKGKVEFGKTERKRKGGNGVKSGGRKKRNTGKERWAVEE
jgi:hypothetical protein